MSKSKKELSFAEEVEQSLRKKFRKNIWCKFTKAINEYELVKPGDRIAVCISGGKDSMLLAKLFQELKRHNKFDFEVKFLVMDPGYSPVNRQVIEENAKRLEIPIEVFESDIFESVFNIEKSPCYLCARMRRGYLYSHAQKMGCNKIALGHHHNDALMQSYYIQAPSHVNRDNLCAFLHRDNMDFCQYLLQYQKCCFQILSTEFQGPLHYPE